MNNDDIPVFPVAAITIGAVPHLGGIIFRPDFLVTMMDKPQDAQTGRTYVLSPAQARYVIEQILSALVTLENASSPDGGSHRH